MKKFIFHFCLLFSIALNAQETNQTYDPNSCCYTFKEVYYKDSPFTGDGPRATSLGIDTLASCYYIVSAGKWKLLNCASGSGSGGSTETADALTILGNGSPSDPFRIDTSLMATVNYVDQKISEIGTGTVGPQGPQGEIGPAGPQGETGPQGPIGPIGLQGLIGQTGPQGAKGDQGDGLTILGSFNDPAELPTTGSPGDAYLIAGDIWVWDLLNNTFNNVGNIQGPPGATGPQGATGATGPIGPQGIQGEIGPTGPVGDQGPIGPPGTQGDKGDIGATGSTGPQGTQGPAGIQGATGATGANGIHCWDTNANGQNDTSEDTNNDGQFNVLDCLPDISGLDDIINGGFAPNFQHQVGMPYAYLDTLSGELWIWNIQANIWEQLNPPGDQNGLYDDNNDGRLTRVGDLNLGLNTKVGLREKIWEFDQLDFNTKIDGATRAFSVSGGGAAVIFAPNDEYGELGMYWRNTARVPGDGRWAFIQGGDVKFNTSFLGLDTINGDLSLLDALHAIEDSMGIVDQQTMQGNGRQNNPYRSDTTFLATRTYVDENVCKYQLSFGDETDGALIIATKPNVTFQRTDNQVSIVEPVGTKICSVTVRGSPANHPSNESLYISIDYQGKNYNQSYLNFKGVDWEVWDIGNFIPGDTVGAQWKSTDDSPPSPTKTITKVLNGVVTTKTSNLGNYANYMIDFTKI